VNLTVTVQVAPGAKVAPVQVSGPPSRPPLIKDHVRIPDPGAATVALVTVNCAPPAGAVLVSATVLVPVMVPVGKVMVSGFGVIDTVARFATLAPVSATGVGVTTVPGLV
jgi:hypothetical protein